MNIDITNTWKDERAIILIPTIYITWGEDKTIDFAWLAWVIEVEL